jgi:hypothetical protein
VGADLNRVEVVEAEPGRSPGGELRLGGDDGAEGGMELWVLIGADQREIILGRSGSLTGVQEEADTITGS